MENVWMDKQYGAKFKRIEKGSTDRSKRERAETESLQDRFLSCVKENKTTLDVYLKNESIRRGKILDYDNWTILLLSDGKYYLLFKSAVMGIIPIENISLRGIPEPQKSPAAAYAARVADGGHEPYYYERARL